MKANFASDNFSGVLPEVMAAMNKANTGPAPAYGADEWTARAVQAFRSHFGEHAEVFFAFNGTAANVLSLQAMMRPFEAVLCGDSAHIAVDECGAPERLTGAKLLTVPHHHGKIRVEDLERQLVGIGDQHHVQPRVISISQTTELGTVYSVDELREISEFAQKNGLYLHMDGARLCNAAAALELPFREFTLDVGVDVLSFGGTKTGLMGAESVVFLNPNLTRDFKFIRKQSMQLSSKMRFIGAQFIALFEQDLWKRAAGHANAMARLLESKICDIPGLQLEVATQANALFPRVPKEWVPRLQKDFNFYVWKSGITHDQVRWMTSWNTSEADVLRFAAAIQSLGNQTGQPSS
jgi:threonine aldolase